VLLGRLFATLSYKIPALQTYDLQLGHWGIGRVGNESFQDMRARLEDLNGPVRRWALSRHNAFYDNSIKGVSELPEATTKPSAHIYYFTLSFHATVPFPSAYPQWAPEAAGTFPISLLQFARAILQHIPIVGGLAERLLNNLVGVSGWAVFSASVRLRDLSLWVTVDVVQRLLRTFGYNLILPTPGKYLPRRDVIPLMLPTVYAMGGQDLSDDEKEILGPNRGNWYLNDGIVNTASMNGPIGAEVFDITNFPTSEPDIRTSEARGRYWDFGVNDKMDHADEIGVWVERTTVSASAFVMKVCRSLQKVGCDDRDVRKPCRSCVTIAGGDLAPIESLVTPRPAL
jgi:hypothetical protein